MRLFLLLAALMIPAAAHAQQPDRSAYRSPESATLLSVFSTWAPIGLAVAIPNDGRSNDITALQIGLVACGVMAGPSTGYVYVGGRANWLRALRGVGIRAAGTAMIGYGVGSGIGGDGSEGSGLFLAGVGLIAVSAFYDTFRAPKLAEEANERNGLAVGPALVGRSMDAGVMVRYRF